MLYGQLNNCYSGVKLFSSLKTFSWFSRPKHRTVHVTVLNNAICSCFTGQPEVFKSTSGRIVMLTSYLTSLVLMAAYSAFLISSLTVQHQDMPFRDLQGLLYDGSYRLGVMRNSSSLNMFDVCGIKYFWTDYLVGVGLKWGDKLVGRETCSTKRVLFGKYVKANWGFEFIQIRKIILKDVIPRLAALRTFYKWSYHKNSNYVQRH